MAKITFADKITLAPQPDIANENKCTASDLNEIKNSVNDNCTYATNEVCIGEYLGKPLYRMAIESTSYSSNYRIGADKVDKIVNAGGMIRRSDYDIWQFIPSRLDNASFSIQFGNMQIYNGYVQILISAGTSWSSTMSRIIIYIEYTKTTD